MTDPVARLTIEYDGTDFSGWARQPGRRTVQAELERALSVLLRRPEVPLTVAGRTDAGVHARGQVASHPGPPAAVDGLNALLPFDIAVTRSVAAPPGFDARRDATSRAYAYRILTRPARSPFERRHALHWTRPLDLGLLRECAELVIGRHDFTAFTPTQTEHVHFHRHVLAARWEVAPDWIEFHIEADAFMRNMIRVLVGTMLELGGGDGDRSAGRGRGRSAGRGAERFAELLQGRPRADAGRTAPPHGLCFLGAGYGGERVLPAA